MSNSKISLSESQLRNYLFNLFLNQEKKKKIHNLNEKVEDKKTGRRVLKEQSGDEKSGNLTIKNDLMNDNEKLNLNEFLLESGDKFNKFNDSLYINYNYKLIDFLNNNGKNVNLLIDKFKKRVEVDLNYVNDMNRYKMFESAADLSLYKKYNIVASSISQLVLNMFDNLIKSEVSSGKNAFELIDNFLKKYHADVYQTMQTDGLYDYSLKGVAAQKLKKLYKEKNYGGETGEKLIGTLKNILRKEDNDEKKKDKTGEEELKFRINRFMGIQELFVSNVLKEINNVTDQNKKSIDVGLKNKNFDIKGLAVNEINQSFYKSVIADYKDTYGDIFSKEAEKYIRLVEAISDNDTNGNIINDNSYIVGLYNNKNYTRADNNTEVDLTNKINELVILSFISESSKFDSLEQQTSKMTNSFQIDLIKKIPYIYSVNISSLYNNYPDLNLTFVKQENIDAPNFKVFPDNLKFAIYKINNNSVNNLKTQKSEKLFNIFKNLNIFKTNNLQMQFNNLFTESDNSIASLQVKPEVLTKNI